MSKLSRWKPLYNDGVNRYLATEASILGSIFVTTTISVIYWWSDVVRRSPVRNSLFTLRFYKRGHLLLLTMLRMCRLPRAFTQSTLTKSFGCKFSDASAVQACIGRCPTSITGNEYVKPCQTTLGYTTPSKAIICSRPFIALEPTLNASRTQGSRKKAPSPQEVCRWPTPTQGLT